MDVYCIEEFKAAFEKLKSNNSYRNISKLIIQHFFDKTVEELKNGIRLNGHSEIPFIKKRLDGSGGFRIYFLLVIKNDSLYLTFLHPKTGSKGYKNIDKKFKTYLLKEVHKCIENKSILKVEKNKKGDGLIFSAV